MGCWTEVLEFVFIAFLVVQLLRLLLADADLTLLFKEKFGTRPERLCGKVVWITGASGGIGEYLAYDLARIGCKLVLSARRKDELDRVRLQCLSQGCIKEDDIFTLPLDLLAYDTHSKATQEVLEKFKQIDILVNNAGLGQNASVLNTKLEVDKQFVDLNYLGTLSLTKTVLPHMVERKQGHVVVTGSVAGKMGYHRSHALFSVAASPYLASYSASKFALHGWFGAMRFEQSRNNITVTLVCPGPVVSDIRANCITDTPGKSAPKEDAMQKWISTERCAELMTVAIANKLDEVWISEHPILLFNYAAQYIPSVYTFLTNRFGMKMLLKMRRKAGHSE